MALTPELLYSLWTNFQRDIHGQILDIPWFAVSDLLLSSLCNEVGYELYEMDFEVRNKLLNELQKNERFGQKRIKDLSNFLLDYIQQQLKSDDPDIVDFAKAQKWTILAYTQPSQAARKLALEFSKLDENNLTERIRLASITETFAEPLAEFQPLLIYARAMRKFTLGNLEAARDEMTKLPAVGKQIQVAGVSLPIPEEIKVKVKQKAINPLILIGVISSFIVGGIFALTQFIISAKLELPIISNLQIILLNFVITFGKLFAIANPFSAVSVFLDLVPPPQKDAYPDGETDEDEYKKYRKFSRQQALLTAITVFLVLILSLLVGKVLFPFFGINFAMLLQGL